MNIKPDEDVPKTVGELRRRLAKMGNPWEVDPRLGDDDPLPDRPRGGQLEEEIPEEHRLKTLEPGSDLQGFIARQQPSNPFLRARWVEVGMLKQSDLGSFVAAQSDEGQEDAG